MTDFSLNRERLFEMMHSREISSLRQLSELAGVHRNTLYPLVRGERSPYSESFLALCATLKIEPQALITERSNPELDSIKNIARQVVEEHRAKLPSLAVFLFGSRASGKAKRYSDYDLGLTGGARTLTSDLYLRLRERVLQLGDDLPVKIDILNFDAAPSNFLADFASPLAYLAGDPASVAFLEGFIYGHQANTQTERRA